MSQDIINNRFWEESVFAIADGYCVINLTKEYRTWFHVSGS